MSAEYSIDPYVHLLLINRLCPRHAADWRGRHRSTFPNTRRERVSRLRPIQMGRRASLPRRQQVWFTRFDFATWPALRRHEAWHMERERGLASDDQDSGNFALPSKPGRGVQAPRKATVVLTNRAVPILATYRYSSSGCDRSHSHERRLADIPCLQL